MITIDRIEVSWFSADRLEFPDSRLSVTFHCFDSIGKQIPGYGATWGCRPGGEEWELFAAIIGAIISKGRGFLVKAGYPPEAGAEVCYLDLAYKGGPAYRGFCLEFIPPGFDRRMAGALVIGGDESAVRVNGREVVEVALGREVLATVDKWLAQIESIMLKIRKGGK